MPITIHPRPVFISLPKIEISKQGAGWDFTYTVQLFCANPNPIIETRVCTIPLPNRSPEIQLSIVKTDIMETIETMINEKIMHTMVIQIDWGSVFTLLISKGTEN